MCLHYINKRWYCIIKLRQKKGRTFLYTSLPSNPSLSENLSCNMSEPLEGEMRLCLCTSLVTTRVQTSPDQRDLVWNSQESEATFCSDRRANSIAVFFGAKAFQIWLFCTTCSNNPQQTHVEAEVWNTRFGILPCTVSKTSNPAQWKETCGPWMASFPALAEHLRGSIYHMASPSYHTAIPLRTVGF